MHSVNTNEARKILNVSKTEVLRLLKVGWLKGVKTWRTGSITMVWQIDMDSIDEYQKNRRSKGRPSKG
jgi:hypothetical protein